MHVVVDELHHRAEAQRLHEAVATVLLQDPDQLVAAALPVHYYHKQLVVS